MDRCVKMVPLEKSIRFRFERFHFIRDGNGIRGSRSQSEASRIRHAEFILKILDSQGIGGLYK